MRPPIVFVVRGVRVFLAAGVWMATNLLFYKFYLMMAPVALSPNILAFYWPILPAALAYLWTYHDLRATGRARLVLTLLGVVAHATLWGYFFVFTYMYD